MDVSPTNKQLYPDSLGLNENINTEPLDQDKINEALSGLNNNNNMSLSGIMKQIQQIPAASYNMANDTKWIFHIPYGFLFMGETENRENLEIPLGCQSVNFPDFKIGTTQVGFMGYGIDLSTRQNLTDKGLTINFLINSNWIQYLALLKWFELEDYTPYTREEVSKPTFYDMNDHNWLWGISITANDVTKNYGNPSWPSQLGSFSASAYTAGVGCYKCINSLLYDIIPDSDIRKHWWVNKDLQSDLSARTHRLDCPHCNSDSRNN